MCTKHARLAFDFVTRTCTLVFQGNKQLEKTSPEIGRKAVEKDLTSNGSPVVY